MCEHTFLDIDANFTEVEEYPLWVGRGFIGGTFWNIVLGITNSFVTVNSNLPYLRILSRNKWSHNYDA